MKPSTKVSKILDSLCVVSQTITGTVGLDDRGPVSVKRSFVCPPRETETETEADRRPWRGFLPLTAETVVRRDVTPTALRGSPETAATMVEAERKVLYENRRCPILVGAKREKSYFEIGLSP